MSSILKGTYNPEEYNEFCKNFKDPSIYLKIANKIGMKNEKEAKELHNLLKDKAYYDEDCALTFCILRELSKIYPQLNVF